MPHRFCVNLWRPSIYLQKMCTPHRMVLLDPSSFLSALDSLFHITRTKGSLYLTIKKGEASSVSRAPCLSFFLFIFKKTASMAQLHPSVSSSVSISHMVSFHLAHHVLLPIVPLLSFSSQEAPCAWWRGRPCQGLTTAKEWIERRNAHTCKGTCRKTKIFHHSGGRRGRHLFPRGPF